MYNAIKSEIVYALIWIVFVAAKWVPQDGMILINFVFVLTR